MSSDYWLEIRDLYPTKIAVRDYVNKVFPYVEHRLYPLYAFLQNAGLDVYIGNDYMYLYNVDYPKTYTADEVVAKVLSIKPDTPVTLLIGTVKEMEHYCPWGDMKPVLKDVCDQCVFKMEYRKGNTYNYAVADMVVCGHPGSKMNLNLK